MAHSLSSHEIALLVGSQAFSRGERYARNGHVLSEVWDDSGTRLTGKVRGTGRTPYTVTISFILNPAGVAVRATGLCTCPMRTNCKHVAALLVTSRNGGNPGSIEVDEGDVDRFRRRSAPPALYALQSPRVPAAPATPTVPRWRSALGGLPTPGEAAAQTGTELALQFQVLAPINSRFQSGGRHLAARPMLLGKQGRWIRGALTWDNIAQTAGTAQRAQRRVLSALYALHLAGRPYYGSATQWIQLDDFPDRALWGLLEEATAAGIPLISTSGAQDPVHIHERPASLELDIRRTTAGLALTPAVVLDERRLPGGRFGFTGDPAHGIYTWQDAPAGDPTGGRLTLAPLAVEVSRELRNLAVTGQSIDVPTDDEADFLAEFYPYLRDRALVTSRDASFELPETPRPALALTLSHQADARITLNWAWRYQAGPVAGISTVSGTASGTGADAYDLELRPSPGEHRYRDTVAEARILRSVDELLAPLVELTPRRGGVPRLSGHSELTGVGMIDFLEGVVPRLKAIPDVLVVERGDVVGYRQADSAPVISVGTSERLDDRDWFNLAVSVSIDGEDVPFDVLFRALATGQDILILPSGIYFSLDRPELHTLRRLIEEARSLQEPSATSLGISPFQADLWEELQELGVVTSQAAGWRDIVAGLTDVERVPTLPLPDGVHATLRSYQQSGFEWLGFLLDHRLGGILADDMGLGKTLQAIALISRAVAARDSAAPAHPFLVVAPTSVVSNWAAECARFAPDLRVASVTETSRKRATNIAALHAEADVVITSYTLFRLDFDEYNAVPWEGLLLDEAQFVKNRASRAYQCARRLDTPFKLAITGTPLENNLMEFWSLLSITAPGLFPSPSRFADYYQKPIERDANDERLAQLRRRIRPFMLRRTKEEVAGDLPSKQEQVLELTLNPRHRAVYDTHLARERQKVLGLIENLNANRFEIFRSLTMLRQLSLDAGLYDAKYDGIPSTKLDALLELLEDIVAGGHRTLIFSQFTQYLGRARARLEAAGISYSYLDGKTRNRAAVIDEFKTGDNSVFLISLKAGGFGLNLTEADYAILLDPWWNPATEAQAVDRMHRIGQTKNVFVYRLVAKNTIEEKVMALKATKARLFDSVLSADGARGTALTAADIRELLS
ncbi:DEAD/DEAH box helicase [Cryobacterium sp. RTS3]|uniref:DEAD/DEAH box helicase n=1 Tax=Cryobacterium sp. RTS3 TaxID=3048643 RepID=UPI002B23C64D|nr:DEAD/DEAH box helicase [Cryobacterium sp. RTS3]MEB0000826.1 DEAD/DEAH box helicase [Cryobacterium sp. RTS3]